jgi:hypothetical protein
MLFSFEGISGLSISNTASIIKGASTGTSTGTGGGYARTKRSGRSIAMSADARLKADLEEYSSMDAFTTLMSVVVALCRYIKRHPCMLDRANSWLEANSWLYGVAIISGFVFGWLSLLCCPALWCVCLDNSAWCAWRRWFGFVTDTASAAMECPCVVIRGFDYRFCYCNLHVRGSRL